MASTLSICDPERRLALAYAPSVRRSELALLWLLDERLGAIVAAARDPMLGQIRLAWWREAVLALNQDLRVDEPLLSALAPLVRDGRLKAATLAELVEGWDALLAPMPLDDATLRRHGALRGSLLFGLVADLMSSTHPTLADAGAGWALMDLACRITDRPTADHAMLLAADHLTDVKGRWPRALRPLAVLIVLARKDCRGRTLGRRQGSPARVMLAIWAGLTGR